MKAFFSYGFSCLKSLLIDKAIINEKFWSRSGRIIGGRYDYSCRITNIIVISIMLVPLCEKVCAAELAYDIDIPASNAAEALNRLAEQTDAILLFPYDQAEARQANRVVGRYSLVKALDLLLSGSGLAGSLTDKQVIQISSSEEPNRAEEDGDVAKKKQSIGKKVSTFLASVFMASAASGQGVDQSLNVPRVIEEVVVTANKRGAQSLQDTPGSIQAITSETLERSLVEGFEDYIKMVPGLTSVSSGTGQSQIVIRGVNAARVTHSSSQIRSLAGLYIDEMPISLAGFNPDLGVVDIERIEVLRGPQGTLYGASSMSGTIRVITKKPQTEEVSGGISVDTSNTQDGDTNYGFKASANMPLSDKIAMRVGGYASHKGGFIDNVAPGFEEENYNSEDTIGGKGQVAYYGDKLTATATLMFNKLEADGRPDEYVLDTNDPRIATVTDELQTVKVVQDTYFNEFLGFNFTFDYDLGGVNLTSATSLFDTTVSNRLDDTFRVLAVTPIDAPFSDFQNDTDYRTYIEEIRLSSTYDSPLQWIVGAYYESNRREFKQTQPTPGTNAFFEALTAAGNFPPDLCGTLVSTCFGAVEDSVLDVDESVDTDQVAVFGEVTYSFTEAIRLKLGFRWFDYESDVFTFTRGAANNGMSIDEDVLKESDWVPKVELAYDIAEDHMVYATFSEGFRLGGVNGFIPDQCNAQLVTLGTTTGAPFRSDSLTTYEIGAKTAWLDNRLTANMAVFLNEFDNIQSEINLDCGFFHRFNAGTVENKGVDAEFAYQATDALGLRFGFAYVNSEVKTAVPGLNGDGDETPYVPAFSASGSLEYDVPVRTGFGYVRIDIRYVDSSVNEFSSRSTVRELDAYTVVDLTLGYEPESWRFNIFARNLFDETVITNIDPDRIQPNQLTRGRPRTVGVSVTRRF